MIICILICCATVLADFATKAAAMAYLKPVGQISLIDGVLNLTYLENRGAAFGMLQSHRWVFMLFSAAAIVLLLVYLWRSRKSELLMRVSLSLVVGGGIGNMIDRTRFGYVVDFIDVEAVWSYVFNVADCAVCVGCGLLVICLLRSELRHSRASKNS